MTTGGRGVAALAEGACLLLYRIDGIELSHQHFTWLQPIGQRSSVERPRFAKQGPGGRIERIEADRDGLRRWPDHC